MSYDFDFICDCHAHSKWSFDGCEETDNMCEQAIKLGIKVLTITDHCEVNAWQTPDDSEFGDFSKLIPKSIEHMKKSQSKYADRIKLLRGIELGQPIQDLKSADIALSLDDFDFVLASLHNVRNERDFYWLEYTPERAKELLLAYFNEVLEVVQWNKFDSLAHLTYPLRYITGVHKIAIDINEYLPIIDEIFNTLIKNGKALEVNSSGLRQEIGLTMPNEFLLKRYYNLGGRLITVGSDAHKVADLGKGINEALYLLKDIGFDNYYYFEKHRAVPVPIKNI